MAEARTLKTLMAAGMTAFSLVLGTAGAMAQEAAQPARDFQSFIRDLESDAVARGIRAETAHAALDNVQHIDRVIELDRKQPEFTFTLQEYLDRVVSPHGGLPEERG